MASDSDSSTEHLLSQALPVATIPKDFDPTLPPASAEQYLQQVVWEARHCKDVVTVDLDKKRIKKHGPVVQRNEKATAPQGYAPSMATQRELLASFSQLRTQIADIRTSKTIPKCPVKLPGMKNSEGWCRFCFGNSFQLALLNEANSDLPKPELVEGHQPLLSVMLNISQHGLENLLEWHSQWLEVLGFSEPQGRWFYSILACLEKPLTPESHSQIRHIAKTCASIRAKLDSPDHPDLSQLNVIICIVARYFGQEDLADG